MENSIEISRVGECLLNEVAEMESYQNELKNRMDEANKKVQDIHRAMDENRGQAEAIKIKADQLTELANEFEEEDVKSKILEKRDAQLEGLNPLNDELKNYEAKILEIENDFESLNNLYHTAEYGKNILLAFGVKYGFLIKKGEASENEADTPNNVVEE